MRDAHAATRCCTLPGYAVRYPSTGPSTGPKSSPCRSSRPAPNARGLRGSTHHRPWSGSIWSGGAVERLSDKGRGRLAELLAGGAPAWRMPTRRGDRRQPRHRRVPARRDLDRAGRVRRTLPRHRPGPRSRLHRRRPPRPRGPRPAMHPPQLRPAPRTLPGRPHPRLGGRRHHPRVRPTPLWVPQPLALAASRPGFTPRTRPRRRPRPAPTNRPPRTMAGSTPRHPRRRTSS
jgi:error-prone DNA polymerase